MTSSVTLNGVTYDLTFEDNFDTFEAWKGHGSDGHWATSFSPHLDDTRYLVTPNEGQYYVDPSDIALPNPFSVNNGVLSIHATELDASQQVLADGQEYGSGLLTSELSFGAENGYIEISARAPDQQGFLSSFWLLPADGDWSSEIDIFETLGRESSLLNTNLWDHGTQNQQTIAVNDLSNGFQTFGLEWTETSITWYLNGQAVRTVNNTVHEEMFLALSLAVDSTWAGGVDATTDFNDAFEIDYIRVYEVDAPGNNGTINSGEFFDKAKVYGETSTSDDLYGTQWDDTFNGGDGGDKMYGRDGADTIHGDGGSDQVFGQNGDDALFGDEGNDKLIGGTGEDRLEGGVGTDHLWGGVWSADGEADTFVFNPSGGKDFVHDFEVGLDVIDLAAFGTDWASLSAAMHDHGWATYIDAAAIGGNAGDRIYLIGTDTSALTFDDFVFGVGV